MKQIRLNKYTLKVENCGECPICDAPFWYCSLKADVREKNITAGTPQIVHLRFTRRKYETNQIET